MRLICSIKKRNSRLYEAHLVQKNTFSCFMSLINDEIKYFVPYEAHLIGKTSDFTLYEAHLSQKELFHAL